MTQEDKQLLLKDLSARLVYEVKVKYWPDSSVWGKHISPETCLLTMDILTSVFKREYSKRVCLPYLRPMSSMTDEEKEQLAIIRDDDFQLVRQWVKNESFKETGVPCPVTCGEIDYCNKKHLDYRGLIPMGLAIEAPKGMYNIN